MSRHRFEAAVEAAVAALGLSRGKDLVGLLAQRRTKERALTELATPGVGVAVADVYDAMEAESVPPAEAAAYVRGYVAALLRARDTVQVRTVWSGPSTPAVPVRATAQVLVEVIDQAREELLAMTYAARPYPALTRALAEATSRGVETHIVVETLAGARGLLSGREPADAFASVPGLRLWHWARDRSAQVRSRQHAKLAVADRRTLFVGSANLTESASRRNIEAGVLVSGGEAPRRAAEHVVELQRLGVLQPMDAVGRTSVSRRP
ncbi:DISARM system phospholipase D-like protein DrmC [Streptomyces sp. NPDC017179]|uniref:DISARM system phospholipase D-like protein DrmC n=1 Tax=Streptomyces sp. NPDC017179 TaxID=3364979 RepID=UPI0037AE1B19